MTKPRINVVFIGHVDHGKSTLVGRLMVELGIIHEKLLRQYQEEGKQMGKESFFLAWIMDKTPEERRRGVTIDVAWKELETRHRLITIVDAPGHRDFVKNMITGTSEADAAVLLIAADDGVMAQTKEHAILAKAFGISQLLVVINKMDLVNYSRDRYEKIVSDAKEFLIKVLKFPEENVTFIPVSAFKGENVTKKSSQMGWYDGPTFLDALDNLNPPKELPIDKPFRLIVDEVANISGVGTIVCGAVVYGRIKLGDKVVVMPSGVTGEIRSIEEWKKPIREASVGQEVGMSIRGVGRKDVRVGYVVGTPDSPPTVPIEFLAQVSIFDHPSGLHVGYQPTIHVHTARAPVLCSEILARIDPSTGNVIENNPDYIRNGEAGLVRMRLERIPIVMESQENYPRLSHFAIRDIGKTIGAGRCVKIIERRDIKVK